MQIVVLGAGAIGSLYAAHLAEQNNVIMVGRHDHVRAIRQNGLHVHGLESRTLHISATTRLERLEPDALILLTTKVPATTSALLPVAPLVCEDSTIVVLQNGLNAEGIARDILNGRGVVLRGITQFGAIFDSPGKIRYMAKGYTILEDHERSSRIAAVLNEAGLDCRISADIKRDVWRKVVFNCVVNPITTIIRGKVGDIANPLLNRLKQLVIDECIAVAAAEGVPLEDDLGEQVNATYAGSDNIVSMEQDLLRGRVTEIDYLNGAVAVVGAKHGLRCPVNESLTRIIKAMEEMSRRTRRSEAPLTPQAAVDRVTCD